MKMSNETRDQLAKIPSLLTGLAEAAVKLAKDLLETSEALTKDIRQIITEDQQSNS